MPLSVVQELGDGSSAKSSNEVLTNIAHSNKEVAFSYNGTIITESSCRTDENELAT